MNDPFWPRYDWLVPVETPNDRGGPGGERPSDSPVIAAELRDGIAGITKTSATFRVSDIVGRKHATNASDRLVNFCGAWKVPGFYSATRGRTRKFVNPGYVHAHRYPGVWGRCRCGALAVKPDPNRTGEAVDGAHEHSDRCRRTWRLSMRALIGQKRARAAARLAALGLSCRSMSPMFGVEDSMAVGHVFDAECIDRGKIAARASAKKTNTMAALFACGFTADTAGAAFGLTRNTVRGRFRNAGFGIKDLRPLRETGWTPGGRRTARGSPVPTGTADLAEIHNATPGMVVDP